MDQSKILTKVFSVNYYEKVLKMLFITSIILIPFDNLPYFKKVFGELSVRGSVYSYFGIIILLMFTIKINKIKELYKYKSIKILLFFTIWVLLSSFLNINSILTSCFKGRLGIEKFIFQFCVLFFMIIILFINMYIIELFKLSIFDLRKYIIFSFIIVGVYSFFEFINLTGMLDVSFIIKKISFYVHTYNRGIIYTKGIRSVTGETSYFAMYSTFILPWVLSYIFTSKTKRNKLAYSFLTSYVLLLIVFSKSRTAYAITFIQLFLYILSIFIFDMKKSTKKMAIVFFICILTLFALLNKTIIRKYAGDANSINRISIKSLYKSLTDQNNMSNVARKGMQRAAINISKDRPIIGVGLGQFGFYAPQYVDSIALKSNEVKRWIDPNRLESWPPAFSLYPRILAEHGVIGLGLWIMFLLNIVYKIVIKIKRNFDDVIGVSLLVSFIGVLLSSFNADTYALIQLWLLLSLSIKYCDCEN